MDRKEIPALKVNQWLAEWENITWDEDAYQSEPEPCFYIFSISALDLKGLSGVRRRPKRDGVGRVSEQNIQRAHNTQRSQEINTFIKLGYPLSAINEKQREDAENRILQKPGWLPTAIVVNILQPGDQRNGKTIHQEDLVKLSEKDDHTLIILPEEFTGINWNPHENSLRPIEVIDGQHRLWAFENETKEELQNYELPVVAFYGLDISWQAYLFWMINIKPVKINSSLAFDLYPLLRKEEWLERFSGPRVYREIRAQEIIDLLYSYENGIWYKKIDMLGTQRGKLTSQTSWINTLLATYIKEATGTSRNVGGIFGAPRNSDELLIPWRLTQQAAFLTFLWKKFFEEIQRCSHNWAEQIKKSQPQQLFQDKDQDEPLFWGKESIINSDQGIRGFHYITNDLYNLAFQKQLIDLENVFNEDDIDISDSDQDISLQNTEIDYWVSYLKSNDKIQKFTNSLMNKLASFDWRSIKADLTDLSEEDRTIKRSLRGSGGYKELRRQLLKHLMTSKGEISDLARENFKILGYE